MEINGPPPSLIKPTQMPSAISNWQVGQVLQATVVKQATPQNLILQVGNQQLQADTTVSLPVGQKLELRVSQLGDKPILQARILSQTPQTANTPQTAATHTTAQPSQPVATDAAINILLKQALPKQASMATLLANLTWLNQSASKTVPIPAVVLDIAKQLFRQLPTKENINQAGQLKQNMLNSGIFLESKLNKLASDKTPQTLRQTTKQTKQTPLGKTQENIAVTPTDKIAKTLKQAIQQSLQIQRDKTPTGTPTSPTDNTLQTLKQALQQSPATQLGKTQTSIAASPTDKSSADLKLGLLRLLGAIQQITKTGSTTTPQPPLSQTSPQASPQALPLPFTAPPMRGATPQAQPGAKANLAGMTNLPLLLLELGKQVESSLARTQLHQVASMPASEQSPTNLAFELPIRNNGHIDIFDIVINEEDKQNRDEKDNKQQWDISLAFDLGGLGPVHAKLRMIDNKISTTFWTESAETTQLFNKNLENLRQRYHQAGLESSELCCYPGKPPVSTSSNLPHIVLDINV